MSISRLLGKQKAKSMPLNSLDEEDRGGTGSGSLVEGETPASVRKPWLKELLLGGFRGIEISIGLCSTTYHTM